jgi:hypothetical protein
MTINMVELEKKMAEFQATKPLGKIHQGKIWMAPQFRGGRSQWAKWLEKGRIEAHWVTWAWMELPNRKTREGLYRWWIAIRVDSGNGKPVFIDLRDKAGQDKLIALEKAFGRFLIKRRQAKVWAANILSDPSVDFRVELEKVGWTLKILEKIGTLEWKETDILYSRQPDSFDVNLKDRIVTLYF